MYNISPYLQCGVYIIMDISGITDATVNILIAEFKFKYSKLQKENY